MRVWHTHASCIVFALLVEDLVQALHIDLVAHFLLLLFVDEVAQLHGESSV